MTNIVIVMCLAIFGNSYPIPATQPHTLIVSCDQFERLRLQLERYDRPDSSNLDTDRLELGGYFIECKDLMP